MLSVARAACARGGAAKAAANCLGTSCLGTRCGKSRLGASCLGTSNLDRSCRGFIKMLDWGLLCADASQSSEPQALCDCSWRQQGWDGLRGLGEGGSGRGPGGGSTQGGYVLRVGGSLRGLCAWLSHDGNSPVKNIRAVFEKASGARTSCVLWNSDCAGLWAAKQAPRAFLADQRVAQSEFHKKSHITSKGDLKICQNGPKLFSGALIYSYMALCLPASENGAGRCFDKTLQAHTRPVPSLCALHRATAP